MVDVPNNHSSDLTNDEGKFHLVFGGLGTVIMSDGEKWTKVQPAQLGFGRIYVDYNYGEYFGTHPIGGVLTNDEYKTRDSTLSDWANTSGSCPNDTRIYWDLVQDIVVKYYNVKSCKKYTLNEVVIVDNGVLDIPSSGSPGIIITSGSGYAIIEGDSGRYDGYIGSSITNSTFTMTTSGSPAYKDYVTTIGLIYSPLAGEHISEAYQLFAMDPSGISLYYSSSGSVGCQTSLSLDDGENWDEWQDCRNGYPIPGLTPEQDLTHVQIKLKSIVYCDPTTFIMGTISDTFFMENVPHVESHVNGGDDIFCIVGPDEPLNPFPGMIWWDTSDE